MAAYLLDPTGVRDLSGLLLDASKALRVVPAADLEATTPEERILFGVKHGLYSFPTEELCSYLTTRIEGRRAIEIGAGHGKLADALSIPATDNRQQEEAAIRQHYIRLGQPLVPYGANVEKLDAAAAVAKYNPQVVIACWVTHQFDPRRPEAEGSVTGVDEEAIIAACEEYIFIGNEKVHAGKSIWALPHEKLTPTWLYSRAANGTRDFIAVWRRESVSNRMRP